MNISELEKIVKDGLAKHKVYKEADEALDQIKGLAQADRDLKNKVSLLEKEIAALEAQAESAKSGIAKAEAQADNILDGAGAQAEEIMKDAKVQAAELVAKAEKDLANMKAAAKYEADKLVALQAKTAAAQEEHDKIAAALEKQKDSLKKLLG